MELTTYLDQLHSALMNAAAAGGDDAHKIAERLIAPLESAARLALLEALAAATAEITREIAPGSVDVRLRGRDPEFVVTLPSTFDQDEAAGFATEPQTSPPASADADDGAAARVTLRLPEQLKTRIDDAANQAGLSTNSWLIRTIAAALEDDRSERHPGRRGSGGQRYTGWVR
jgi:hypothetical protein